jgi:hypothetical protein
MSRKNKKAFVFSPLTLTLLVSINKPSIDDIDVTLLGQHYYVKLSDAHVADSVHGCVEIDAGYSKNMNDQCVNRSLNNLKVAMALLENTLKPAAS